MALKTPFIVLCIYGFAIQRKKKKTVSCRGNFLMSKEAVKMQSREKINARNENQNYLFTNFNNLFLINNNSFAINVLFCSKCYKQPICSRE